MKQVRKRNINITYYSHIIGIYQDSEYTNVLINLFAGQQWRNTHREQTYGHGGGEEGQGEMDGKSNMETYNFMCKIDSQWEFPV